MRRAPPPALINPMNAAPTPAQATRRLTNPHWLYQGSLLTAAIAWVTVLCVPRKTVGGSAYVLQLAAQGTFLMAVVTTYGN